jgi:hypothetical protein
VKNGRTVEHASAGHLFDWITVGPEAPQESGPTGELRVWGRPGGMPIPKLAERLSPDPFPTAIAPVAVLTQ